MDFAKQEFPARLFRRKGQPSENCTVKLSREGFQLAIDTDHGVEHLKLPFYNAVPSFGGDRDAMLVITWQQEPEKIDLYLPDRQVQKELPFVAPPDFVDQLEQLQRVKKRSHAIWHLTVAVLLVLLAISSLGGYLLLNFLVDKAVDKVPLSLDIKLGKTFAAHFLQQHELCKNQATVALVEKLGQRLVAALGKCPYEFKFHVIYNQQVNAFALPGGQVFVLTGLIARVRKPEEIAGVLAHEIQHVLKRHAIRRLAHMLKWRLLLSLLLGDISSISERLISKGVDLKLLHNSRQNEFEADAGAVRLLIKANINPTGLADFLSTMDRHRGKLAELLVTHPATAERIKRLRREIASLPSKQYPAIQCDWSKVRKDLRSR